MIKSLDINRTNSPTAGLKWQALNNSRFPLTFWMADRNKASTDFW